MFGPDSKTVTATSMPPCFSQPSPLATKNGAEAYGIDAGEIAEGKLADAVLVDLENERLVPGSNLISDWVYSADSRAIDSVLCDGKFVMRGGRVKNEEEIISSARKAFSRLRSA